ncbi:hypothetical protein HAX54_026806 [Datura stramonium]|uniref:Uncharacterized protein n=1 Tax=Datura stramonium TaxID=4076 RepID=A0ABS8S870_DATST|nr:hypothetical protein [Datura stramonium]
MGHANLSLVTSVEWSQVGSSPGVIMKLVTNMVDRMAGPQRIEKLGMDVFGGDEQVLFLGSSMVEWDDAE